MDAGLKDGSRGHVPGSAEQAEAGPCRLTGTTEPAGWTADAAADYQIWTADKRPDVDH